MLILPPQQAVIDSLRTSLAAHLEPDIHIPSLVRLLDLLAHTALLADKLATEIDRIRRHPGFRLEAKDKISLVGLKATAEEAGRTLWEETLRLRELGIAKPLCSAGPLRMRPIEGLFDKLYGPTAGVGEVKPSDMNRKRHEPLYLSSMPLWLSQFLVESSRRVRRWLIDASNTGKRDDTSEMEQVCQQRDVIRASVLESSNQIFDCMEMASHILDEYAVRKPEIGVKEEGAETPHRPVQRRARSRSAPPRRDQSRTERGPTVAETYRIRIDTPQSIIRAQANGDPDKTAALERQRDERSKLDTLSRRHSPPIRQTTEQGLTRRPESGPLVKPAKKRNRPSFPPREGPSYMRSPAETMTASPASKRQRLHPFQTKDLK